MLKHFRSSPLWLIGLFIIFAQGSAGVASIQIDGWPQSALVIFVIVYSSVVTAIFFAFLWFKPENFYGPLEYGEISPEAYAGALKGIPNYTASAVSRFGQNPLDRDALFALIDNLLDEENRQHLILMRRIGDVLPVDDVDENGWTHKYEIISRDETAMAGAFSPSEFFDALSGADLVVWSGDKKKLILTERGRQFSDWLVKHERDAITFNSEMGRWGKEQTMKQFLLR